MSKNNFTSSLPLPPPYEASSSYQRPTPSAPPFETSLLSQGGQMPSAPPYEPPTSSSSGQGAPPPYHRFSGALELSRTSAYFTNSHQHLQQQQPQHHHHHHHHGHHHHHHHHHGHHHHHHHDSHEDPRMKLELFHHIFCKKADHCDC